MTTKDRARRNQRARLKYANDRDVREAAKARSKRQRSRLKVDPEYRARRNQWQRRWDRKAKREANLDPTGDIKG